MKIEVLMTEKTFVRFSTFDILRRRKMWRSPVIFAAILSVSAAICFAMHHVDGAVALGVVLLLVGLGIPVVYFSSFSYSLRTQVKSLGLKRPQNVYTLELSEADQGIHVYNEKETVDYAWKQVYHVYRDTLATYLYMTPERAFVLPHTCLGDQEPEDLWALLGKVLPQEKLTVL